MSSERPIASVAIYPGIGIARVGNSDEYFLGPEIPYPVSQPPEFYRDAQGRLKREAARFRIYGFDGDGRVVREITAAEATIRWTVEVANKKASWYQFVTAMDIPEAQPTPRRNANYQGAARQALEITPGPHSIEGIDQTVGPLAGTFLGTPVELGELRTDEAGRLVFLGGRGVSGSPYANNPPYTFGNNDGWHDDVSDGPVHATVTLDGRTLEAKPAWVAVGPPNFAPDLFGIVTLYDVLIDTYTGLWLPQPKRPSFQRDILPILQRFSTTQWVNQGFLAQFGWEGPFDFERMLPRLASSAQEFRELRRQIFNQFGYPSMTNGGVNLTVPDNTALSAGPDVDAWPWFYGDAVSMSDPTANCYLTVTALQYQFLGQWAAGDFAADWDPGFQPPASLDQVPLAEQPGTLDRAAMEFCLGGAFHPGCELTWPMRSFTMYSEPFRIRERSADDAEPDYGDVLTPDQVSINGTPTAGGPLYFNGPGDLTRFMAVPWQTDSASCRSGYVPAYDPYLPTFWPARVPNQVLTEEDYEILMDPGTPLPERLAAFRRRAVWYRFLGPDFAYLQQIDTMIHHFGDLGLIAKLPGPGIPELPSEMYVETGVQFPTADVPRDRGKIVVWREKLLHATRLRGGHGGR
jgi:L-Lysine epsilon oxidase N-terminal/L-lysine epsilon oxidase C-terminal domain